MAKSDPVEEALNQLKSLAGSTGVQAVSPIGVPAYTAGADGQAVPFTGGNNVPVRYYEGSDWAPASLNAADRARLQARLIAAGLIPRGANIRNGEWDEVTRAAYRSVLTYANATGLDAQAALNALQSAPQTTVPTPHLTPDIASVASTVKQTVKSKLGRDATPDEVKRLSNVLMGFEEHAIDVQDQMDDPSFQGGQAVDPGARLDLYLEQQYKPEIQRDAAVADLSTSRTNLMGNIFSLDQAIAR